MRVTFTAHSLGQQVKGNMMQHVSFEGSNGAVALSSAVGTCSYLPFGSSATLRALFFLSCILALHAVVVLQRTRGAGAAGLGSMGRRRHISGQLPLVRPLLHLDRSSTLEVCTLTGTRVRLLFCP
eukprot:GHRQ01025072.1.p1 GENE.GHRQ01025072.1~~GHRQ01025072.1.p1  ORF type:complete len:125 (-),score=25.74 GHRQ01025072.1:136-510(-)